MSEQVLIVDDDTNLLAALRRQLRGQLDVITAEGGEEALRIVGEGTPIAVVLCDMRMPGMDGIAVLEACHRQSPNTVRMMLTGNADQETAVNAINKGEIFRFLNKPCEPELLISSLKAGIRQHQLVTAERELLETTLAGSVKLLLDVLKLSGSLAADSAQTLRKWGKVLAHSLQIEEPWKLDMAVMLAGIGIVAVPAEIAAKLVDDQGLTAEERQLVDQVPQFGRDLIANIPRLKPVGEIVLLQNRGFDGSGFPADGPKGDALPLESRILNILNGVWKLVGKGVSLGNAFQALEAKKGQFDPDLLAQTRDILIAEFGEGEAESGETQVLPVTMLKPGYVLLSDIETTEGRLILAAGEILSGAQVALLKNWKAITPLREPVEVRVD